MSSAPADQEKGEAVTSQKAHRAGGRGRGRKGKVQAKRLADVDKVHEEEAAELTVGDLVWAKVHTIPWWPAKILKREGASPDVLKHDAPGTELVGFFGDGTFKFLKLTALLPFQPHFAELSKQRVQSRTFSRAVREALEDLEQLELENLFKQRKRGSAQPEKKTALGALQYVRQLAVDLGKKLPSDPFSSAQFRARLIFHRESTFANQPFQNAKGMARENEDGWEDYVEGGEEGGPKEEQASPKEKKKRGKSEVVRSVKRKDDDSDEEPPPVKSRKGTGVPKEKKVKREGKKEENGSSQKKRQRSSGTPKEKKKSTTADTDKAEKVKKDKPEKPKKDKEKAEQPVKDKPGKPQKEDLESNDADFSSPQNPVPIPQKGEGGKEGGVESEALGGKAAGKKKKRDRVVLKVKREDAHLAVVRTLDGIKEMARDPLAHDFSDPSLSKSKSGFFAYRRRYFAGERSHVIEAKAKAAIANQDRVKALQGLVGQKRRVEQEKAKGGGEGGAKSSSEEEGESSDEETPKRKRSKVTPTLVTRTDARKAVGASPNKEKVPLKAPPQVKVGLKPERQRPVHPPQPEEEPMVLFMRFPEGFALPSEAQLKAIFMKHGELASWKFATRVLHKKNSAQVVFKRSSVAESVYRACVGPAIRLKPFGNSYVQYQLRQVKYTDDYQTRQEPNTPRTPSSLDYEDLLRNPSSRHYRPPPQDQTAPPGFSNRPSSILDSQLPEYTGFQDIQQPKQIEHPPKSILRDPRRATPAPPPPPPPPPAPPRPYPTLQPELAAKVVAAYQGPPAYNTPFAQGAYAGPTSYNNQGYPPPQGFAPGNYPPGVFNPAAYNSTRPGAPRASPPAYGHPHYAPLRPMPTPQVPGAIPLAPPAPPPPPPRPPQQQPVLAVQESNTPAQPKPDAAQLPPEDPAFQSQLMSLLQAVQGIVSHPPADATPSAPEGAVVEPQEGQA